LEPTENLLTVAEVASRLKCHPHTVRRWIWAGKLRAVKIGDMVRVSENEVSRLIEPTDSRKKDLERHSGVSALRSTMRSLREELDAADVELLESKIAEGEQPAEWSSPIA
jgi:excisionase family DNA binding protein